MQIKDVEHVAKLARLGLSEEEKNTLTHQLSKILDYVETLNKLDTKDVAPATQAIPMSNVFREDKAVPFQNTQDILANGPDRNNRFFKVPKILE